MLQCLWCFILSHLPVQIPNQVGGYDLICSGMGIKSVSSKQQVLFNGQNDPHNGKLGCTLSSMFPGRLGASFIKGSPYRGKATQIFLSCWQKQKEKKFNLKLLKKISVKLGINITTVTSWLGRRFFTGTEAANTLRPSYPKQSKFLPWHKACHTFPWMAMSSYGSKPHPWRGGHSGVHKLHYSWITKTNKKSWGDSNMHTSEV